MPSPFLIVTYKPEKEFRCRRGCCWEGSSDAILKFAVFDDVDKAAEYVGALEAGARDNDYSMKHRFVSPNRMGDAMNTDWEMESWPEDLCDVEGEVLSKALYEVKYRIQEENQSRESRQKAEEAEAAAREEEKRKERQAREEAERELEEYARLKEKFE